MKRIIILVIGIFLGLLILRKTKQSAKTARVQELKSVNSNPFFETKLLNYWHQFNTH